jgi:glycerol kinase
MRAYLALDQSTSSTKALLFAADGRVLDSEARAHAQHTPRPGWVEHDAEEIWRNVLGVLGAVVGRHRELAGDLACLSLANQRETVVVFERGSGRPLHPAIVWQCRRGDGGCAEQARAGRAPELRRRTGLALDAYFSASKLQWLARHRPELRARMARGEAVAGTVDAYLVHRLTEGRVCATDTTNASRTLLFDINRRAWDPELCGWWDVPPAALPEVRDGLGRFGETTLGGLLPRPLPICGVLGDSQAALLGQGCVRPGMAKVTFGTGSSVLLNIGPEPLGSAQGLVTALAWTHRGAPTYAFEGIIISSAATLAWLRDQLGLIGDFGSTEALAQGVPDNGGVYFVPAFAGLGLPYWQPAARAAVTGLSTASDRRHVVRAALESIAFQLHDVLAAMAGEAPAPVACLYGDGGPTANRFLMQLTADLTGTELRIPAESNGAARGAMLAGRIALGELAGPEAVAPPAGDAVYRPAMPPETVRRLRAGWRAAVRRVLLPAEDRPA